MDRRPLNHGEHRQRWMKLPLGAKLTRLVIGPRQAATGSGYDLSTYFTQLKQHESGVRRNTVSRIVGGLGYEAYGGLPSRKYMLALDCIGMGDINAVDVAEQTHLGALDAHGALHRPGLFVGR